MSDDNGNLNITVSSEDSIWKLLVALRRIVSDSIRCMLYLTYIRMWRRGQPWERGTRIPTYRISSGIVVEK